MEGQDSKFPTTATVDLVRAVAMRWFNTETQADCNIQVSRRRFPQATTRFLPTNAVLLEPVVRLRGRAGRSWLSPALTTMTLRGNLTLRRTNFMCHDFLQQLVLTPLPLPLLITTPSHPPLPYEPRLTRYFTQAWTSSSGLPHCRFPFLTQG